MMDVAIEKRKCVDDGYSELHGVIFDKDDSCALTICFS